MITVRKANERGVAEHGWLHSRFTFSFAEYYDPRHMGFGVLRVINDDHIEGGTGFGMHGHRDMEILTYVIEGELEHRDSMGNRARIRPGEIQRMSAGTGVMHSEYNALTDRQTHLLQIWILPDREGHKPSYAQIPFDERLAHSDFVLLASPKGRDGAITLNQDVELFLGKSKDGSTARHEVAAGRQVWLQVIKGEVETLGHKLTAGDGAAITGERALELKMAAGAEFLLFDLPPEET